MVAPMDNTAAEMAQHSPDPSPRVPGPLHRRYGMPLLREMRADYLSFIARLQREYGDATHIQLGPEHIYDLLSPELVRELLVDNAGQLLRWERGIAVLAQAMGQSVLVTEGDVWKRQRRMLQPAFSPKRVETYASLMAETTAAGLDAVVPAGQDSAVVDISALMTSLTMQVILHTLFSSKGSDEVRPAAESILVLSDIAFAEMFHPFTLPDWLPLPGKARKRAALATLRQLVRRHIDRRRSQDAATAPQGDLLAMLLAVRDEEGDGQPLSASEVFDQCMVIFQTGHDTAATALGWWSRLMAEHPEAMRRAQEEVARVVGERAPTPQDIGRLEWLGATIKEALRLYPPTSVMMIRRTQQDIRVGGWTIPRGAVVRVTPWVIQRDPRWFAEPGEFRPGRFLPDAPAICRGAWMPFGAGPRVCIGQHFAMTEITLIAAMLLQRFDLGVEPQDTQRPPPELRITLRPKGGVRLRLTRRVRAA